MKQPRPPLRAQRRPARVVGSRHHSAARHEPSRLAPSARRGFTLWELVAVLILLGLMASAVVVNLQGHIANARLEMVLDRLEAWDHRGRALARRQGRPLAFVWDLESGRVGLEGLENAAGLPAASLALPRGVRGLQIRTAPQAGPSDHLRIPISAQGQSLTYAVQLQATGGRQKWLAVLGASGQCLRLEQEQDVDALWLP